jgi:hypothetical protein
MIELDVIRRNLIEASASAKRILPYSPPIIEYNIASAWSEFNEFEKYIEANKARPGKQHLGLPILIPIVAAIMAIGGTTSYLAYHVRKSQQLKMLAQCIEENTRRGMSLEKAQKTCNALYGDEPIVSVGGVNVTTIAVIGFLGLAGLMILGKFLK